MDKIHQHQSSLQPKACQVKLFHFLIYSPIISTIHQWNSIISTHSLFLFLEIVGSHADHVGTYCCQCITWKFLQSERRPEPGRTGKAEPAPTAISCLGKAHFASPSPPPENCRRGRVWWWPDGCDRPPPVWVYVNPGWITVKERGRFTSSV